MMNRAGVFNVYQHVCNRVSYHDDFLTPGIRPLLASSRKQILQRPKSPINPCLRPHLKQRRTIRVLNFGFFSDLAITDFLAIIKNNYNTLPASAAACSRPEKFTSACLPAAGSLGTCLAISHVHSSGSIS